MNMPTRETATILAALRLWQLFVSYSGRPLRQALAGIHSPTLQEIVTAAGTLEPLSIKEVEELFQHIANGPDESQLRSALDNAHSALNSAGQFLTRIRHEFAGDSEFVEAAALVDEAVEVARKALDDKPEIYSASKSEVPGFTAPDSKL